MGEAKGIVLKIIPSKIANDFIRKHHYSGTVVPNSNLHFGVFFRGGLHGVMSYGPSMDKKQLIGLVEGTGWNEFMELNRMAFDDVLPRNSESRAIAQSIRMIRKRAPQIKWIISFADGTQCGDGTIYRACGFLLTLIKPNESTCVLPNGTKIHKMTLSGHPMQKRPELGGKCYFDITGGGCRWGAFLRRTGGKLLDGNQLRYVYFIDPECRKKLTVPVMPYTDIDKYGAGMYRGNKVPRSERHGE